MSFVISSENIKSGKIAFILDKDQPSGVRKIAGRVASDMKAVFGVEPEVKTSGKVECPIVVVVVAKYMRSRLKDLLFVSREAIREVRSTDFLRYLSFLVYHPLLTGLMFSLFL